jgi:hypothetical protein
MYQTLASTQTTQWWILIVEVGIIAVCILLGAIPRR